MMADEDERTVTMRMVVHSPMTTTTATTTVSREEFDRRFLAGLPEDIPQPRVVTESSRPYYIFRGGDENYLSLSVCYGALPGRLVTRWRLGELTGNGEEQIGVDYRVSPVLLALIRAVCCGGADTSQEPVPGNLGDSRGG